MFNLLEGLYNSLILETIEFKGNPELLLKMVIRGRFPGVKAKDFFPPSKLPKPMPGEKINQKQRERERERELLDDEEVFGAISKGLKRLEDYIDNDDDFDSFVQLVFKKCGTLEEFKKYIVNNASLNDLLDGFSAYFEHKDKSEIINNSHCMERFEDFVNSPIDTRKIKDFEQWLNEKFEVVLKMKKGEDKVVYKGGGWTVYTPLSFAANRELACLNKRKATWCTAARPSYYKSYSRDGNPIYILINHKKDLMYQMDFGADGGSSPNFKDEKDNAVSYREFKTLGLPDSLLKALKDKHGKTFYEVMNDFYKTSGDIRSVSMKSMPEGETEWKLTRARSLDDLEKKLSLLLNDTVKIYKSDEEGIGVEQIMRKEGKDAQVASFGIITNKDTTYFYSLTSPLDISISISASNKSIKAKGTKFLFKINENSFDQVSIKEFLKLNIPRKIKSVFLSEKVKKEYRGEDIKDVDLDTENVNGMTTITKVNNINDVLNLGKYFTSGERFAAFKNNIKLTKLKNIVFLSIVGNEYIVVYNDGEAEKSSGFSLDKIKKEQALNIINKVDKAGGFNKFKYVKPIALKSVVSFNRKYTITSFGKVAIFLTPTNKGVRVMGATKGSGGDDRPESVDYLIKNANAFGITSYINTLREIEKEYESFFNIKLKGQNE